MKKSKKAVEAVKEDEYDEDDMEGLEEQDGFSDEAQDEEEQQFANADAKGLEAARSYVAFSIRAQSISLMIIHPTAPCSTTRTLRSPHSKTNST